MNKLYFIRHGENVANITKEFSCKEIDYSLTEKGKLQAKQTADYFKNIKIDEIWSSPLKRAIETGTFISKAKGLTLHINENLREINVGSLEKQKPTVESWDIYMSIFNSWKKNEHDVRFPDGENFNEMLSRLKMALIEIFTDKNNSNIAIVGHGGIFSTCIPKICDIRDKKIFLKENNNCSISEFCIEIKNDEIKCDLVKWGYCNHLRGEAAKIVSGYPDFVKR